MSEMSKVDFSDDYFKQFRTPEEKHQDDIAEAHEWHQEWVDGCPICDAEYEDHLKEILS